MGKVVWEIIACQMAPTDIKRQVELVDMMLTMHSILKKRCSRRAMSLEIGLVCVSSILMALTFVDPKFLIRFNIQPVDAQLIIGVCSIIAFIISVVALIVDWKGKSKQHEEAAKSIAALKSEWRECLSSHEKFDDHFKSELSKRSALILSSIVTIPDSQFNKLKHKHYKKVQLSKLISLHPGSSRRLLSIWLWYNSNKKVLLHRRGAEQYHDCNATSK